MGRNSDPPGIKASDGENGGNQHRAPCFPTACGITQ